MKKAVFKKSALMTLKSAIAPVLFTLAVIVIIIYGLGQTESSSRAEGLKVLKESIQRATITCYAITGRYPDDISYIEKNYGIYIDRTKYVVHYDIFASNILPDITVLELTR